MVARVCDLMRVPRPPRGWWLREDREAPPPLPRANGTERYPHRGMAWAKMSRNAPYDRLYREVYQPLFPTLQPLIHRLAELTHGFVGSGDPM